MSKTLIIGGARSGKSRLAQQYALAWQQQTGGQVVVIATAENHHGQGSMAERIAHHQRQRPQDWLTVETARELAKVLAEHDQHQRLLLVDCLTLWLCNELFAGDYPQGKAELVTLLQQPRQGEVVLIGNELGQGVVPLGEDNRRFVDENGWLLQALGQCCDNVLMTIAGQPLALKGQWPPRTPAC
ncbi:bifunctional adenosylcobinamide kinase/adenosylcobinamide-phosphate guanylyltransferase [Ferrimonas senticii]|uniref:bifunctional adenosylcobinamide kinase/adenosylcobinamide-phosphate guanylyltransferase n=1 Tax=Ferrimonas senticii TaxID=394566 RepID=UPI000429403B|nr:bifunctional adenosylcobinamide kinase/adenosylcobinamide-phosphate guanylyltransferase [Ferrimonas senticii]